MHGGAHVVVHAGIVGVGQRAGAAAERGLRLEHLHRQPGPRAHDGGGQAVGPTADDGDVHPTSRPH